VLDIQKSYEIHVIYMYQHASCLKLKNHMVRRKWNRMRLYMLLSSEYMYRDGNWLRKSVGVSSVPVPMLPEDMPDRTLVALQREIEEEFSMKLGSDGSGKSVSASLEKCTCLIADCIFAERVGFLKASEKCINELVQTCNAVRYVHLYVGKTKSRWTRAGTLTGIEEYATDFARLCSAPGMY
jgi:hypothetical protein